MAKKRRNREKKPAKPAKEKYTLYAHIYYRDIISPLEKAYKRAMQAGNYDAAAQCFSKLQAARKEHRLWLARKTKVKIS